MSESPSTLALMTTTKHPMIRAVICLVLVLPLICLVGCDRHDPATVDSLDISVQRESITDFHGFLESLKLLVSQRDGSADVLLRLPGGELSFVSLEEFPGCPIMVHISPDHVAFGSESSRTPLTRDELGRHLENLADLAAQANTLGAVLLVSDQQVSGDFGLSILEIIADAGITAVILTDEEPVSVVGPDLKQKPSAPTFLNR